MDNKINVGDLFIGPHFRLDQEEEIQNGIVIFRVTEVHDNQLMGTKFLIYWDVAYLAFETRYTFFSSDFDAINKYGNIKLSGKFLKFIEHLILTKYGIHV